MRADQMNISSLPPELLGRILNDSVLDGKERCRQALVCPWFRQILKSHPPRPKVMRIEQTVDQSMFDHFEVIAVGLEELQLPSIAADSFPILRAARQARNLQTVSILAVPSYLRPATLGAVGALKQIRHLKLDYLHFWDGVNDASVRNFSKLRALETISFRASLSSRLSEKRFAVLWTALANLRELRGVEMLGVEDRDGRPLDAIAANLGFSFFLQHISFLTQIRAMPGSCWCIFQDLSSSSHQIPSNPCIDDSLLYRSLKLRNDAGVCLEGPGLTEACLKAAFRALTRLTSFSMHSSAAVARPMRAHSPVLGLPGLRELTLCIGPWGDDTTLPAARCCPHCTSLELYGTGDWVSAPAHSPLTTPHSPELFFPVSSHRSALASCSFVEMPRLSYVFPHLHFTVSSGDTVEIVSGLYSAHQIPWMSAFGTAGPGGVFIFMMKYGEFNLLTEVYLSQANSHRRPPHKVGLRCSLQVDMEQLLPYLAPGLRRLRLHNFQLDAFPDAMEHLASLTSLHLSRAGLCRLPVGLEQLTALRVLDLSCNVGLQLEAEDMEVLTVLSHLRTLDLTKWPRHSCCSQKSVDVWTSDSHRVLRRIRTRCVDLDLLS